MTRPADPSEREQIVAWLRAEARGHQRNAKEYGDDEESAGTCMWSALTCLYNANAIERGDHLQSGEGE